MSWLSPCAEYTNVFNILLKKDYYFVPSVKNTEHYFSYLLKLHTHVSFIQYILQAVKTSSICLGLLTRVSESNSPASYVARRERGVHSGCICYRPSCAYSHCMRIGRSAWLCYCEYLLHLNACQSSSQHLQQYPFHLCSIGFW